MKRNILAAVLLLAFIAYSCTTKEDSSLENPASSVSDLVLVKDGSIVYEPSVMVEDFVLDNEDFPDTKTILTFIETGVTFKFANDDKLGVFPYNTTGALQRLFTLKSSSASSCVFNGNGFALTAGTAYAAYYPFIDNANLAATSVNVSYAGQTQTTAKAPGASDASFNLGGADYLVSHASPVGNECNFKMSHIGALVVMDVTVGQSATYTELSLNSSSASFLQTGTLDLTQNINRPTDGTPTQDIEISSTYNANKMTLALGSGSGIYLTAGSQYRFCMMVPPTNVTGTVTIRLKDDSNVEHIAYVGTKNLRQGYAYRYSCTVDAMTDFYTSLGHNLANCYIVNTNSVDADGYFFPTNIAGNGRAVDWASIGFTDGVSEAYPTGGGYLCPVTEWRSS
ncbi:MAG: fimbrillin family protein [Bacteroidales bacterium]|nr:fimbrillin family protein [Bacteroidales bacterium]